jgi:predicted cation transporter
MMLTLLQAATTQPFSAATVATIALGLLQAVLLMYIMSLNVERRELREKMDAQAATIVELRTLITGGNGMATQFDRLVHEISGLRADVHSALQELAEQRGANSRIKGA